MRSPAPTRTSRSVEASQQFVWACAMAATRTASTSTSSRRGCLSACARCSGWRWPRATEHVEPLIQAHSSGRCRWLSLGATIYYHDLRGGGVWGGSPPQYLLYFSLSAAAGYPLGVAALSEKTRFLEGRVPSGCPSKPPRNGRPRNSCY